MTSSDIQSPKPTERDPRVDPRPGDVLHGWGYTKNDITIVKVMRDGRIVFTVQDRFTRRYECLEFYRSMSANAEIVNRGKDA